MLVALTVRRLKPGTLDHYRTLFESVEQPQGWTRSYVARNINDQEEIVSFGFFDGSLDELRRSQEAFDYAAWRARVDDLVESTGTDGIFEIVIEKTP
jgi:hypothetical protein